MINRSVENFLEQARSDIDQAAIMFTDSPSGSISPYLSNYCVIRACGSIEYSIKAIIMDSLKARGISGEVENYLQEKHMKGSQNPALSTIHKILGHFSPAWKNSVIEQLRSLSQEDRSLIETAAKELIDARNSFAHGIPSTMDAPKVQSHFSCFRKVVDIIDSVVSKIPEPVTHPEPHRRARRRVSSSGLRNSAMNNIDENQQ